MKRSMFVLAAAAAIVAGSVLAALGEMQEADAAFKKAVEMHPPYAADVESERESAWIEAFNAGLAKMDEKDYAGAIKLMENAQIIYALRPEGLMNLGALYANANESEKAEKAFQDAINATNAVYQETVRAYLHVTYPNLATEGVQVVGVSVQGLGLVVLALTVQDGRQGCHVCGDI